MFLIYNNKNIQGLGILLASAVAYISVFKKSKARDYYNYYSYYSYYSGKNDTQKSISVICSNNFFLW